MRIGDLVKIQDVSRSPADCRISGVILDDEPYKGRHLYNMKVQVMWQNGVIGVISVGRLERISEASK